MSSFFTCYACGTSSIKYTENKIEMAVNEAVVKSKKDTLRLDFMIRNLVRLTVRDARWYIYPPKGRGHETPQEAIDSGIMEERKK